MESTRFLAIQGFHCARLPAASAPKASWSVAESISACVVLDMTLRVGACSDGEFGCLTNERHFPVPSEPHPDRVGVYGTWVPRREVRTFHQLTFSVEREIMAIVTVDIDLAKHGSNAHRWAREVSWRDKVLNDDALFAWFRSCRHGVLLGRESRSSAALQHGCAHRGHCRDKIKWVARAVASWRTQA